MRRPPPAGAVLSALRLPHRSLGLGTSVPRRRVGAPPGTLPDPAPAERPPAELSAIRYAAGEIEERAAVTVAELAGLRQPGHVLWVNVAGVHDTEMLQGLAAEFGLHPLVQEDLAHPHQRPKVEAYPAGEDAREQLFVVAKMIHPFDAAEASVAVEQVGLVLGDGFVITFTETPGDVFDHVRERLRSGRGRIRQHDAGYLAYALLDVLIDHYFLVMEDLGEAIELLEQAIVDEPQRAQQDQIRSLRRTVLFLRRSVWPLREVIGALMRDESALIDDHTRLYLRDAYDHTIQVVEIIEGFRDVLATMSDIYISSLSHRLNEVMKILTVVGTIFIPLSFLTGIYGMNFHYMPELEFRYGYFTFLAVVAVLLVTALAIFRRRGWI
jgi:magnesium transporter